MTTIEIDTPDGPIDALLSIPPGTGPWPGVVVIHDAFGLLEAIHEAERVTSGEIRVSVAHFFWGDVQRTAEKAFRRLGMENTSRRNGARRKRARRKCEISKVCREG